MSLDQFRDIVFWVFCLISVSGAIYVLISKNIIYAAMGLLACFLGVAGLFIFANAEFVAASQIMIYVGGILILLLFGIMLSSNKKLGLGHLEIENAPFSSSILLATTIFTTLVLISGKLAFIGGEISNSTIKSLGFSLMTSYVLILEIIGMLLLMALIGATYIAKNE